MEAGLLIIFWYGVLHAFGPDHLSAIADFSIGKQKLKTLSVTVLFALGHGLSLFVFAKVLELYVVPSEWLGYGDIVSACVIVGMGVYLLFMVFSDRIQIDKHNHDGKEHIHIYMGKAHNHTSKADSASAFALGTLMGVGGVRGMLVTLGLIEGMRVDFAMVGAFSAGVMLIFLAFGACVLYVNEHFLSSKSSVRNTFGFTGVASISVGLWMLFA